MLGQSRPRFRGVPLVGVVTERTDVRHRLLLLGIAFVLLAACGDDAGSESSTTTTVVSGAVDSLQGVEGAVVQIVAQGSFVDPFEGSQGNVTGGGSGVIIDASGLAITNNHVVTGAALLEVYVDGSDEPVNARVVGVSECSDLAVIDIAGDGYPFVEWYDGAISAGLAIYAAGYPLGDPEFTLLEGIISKADADGESTWASVDTVVEHTAETLPGNSGGPLVTSDGQLVAIAYAANDLGQAFAIGRDVARPVVTQLITGVDVESIGVNGEAFTGDTFSGIWVYSVEAGSPADITGIQAGDLIFELGGLDIGADGTMGAYCDVLRSHLASDVLDITVYRAATEEVLAGQLNGRTLEVTTSFAGGGDLPLGTPYSGYTTITDDSGAITVDVPIEWSDIDGSMAADGPGLAASPDIAAFDATWDVPGVFIVASTIQGVTIEDHLDTLAAPYESACVYEGRHDYDDSLYQGQFDRFDDCGGVGTTLILIVARPSDQTFTVTVTLQLLTQADFDAADQIIATYQITGLEATTATAGYAEYTTITNSTGAITLTIPTEWSDTAEEYSDGPVLIAAIDRGHFIVDWTGSGVAVGASRQDLAKSIDALLDAAGSQANAECTYDTRIVYDIGTLVGKYDRWTNCGGIGTTTVLLFARPPTQDFTVMALFALTEERDLDAFAIVVGNLTVVPVGF